MKFNVDGEQKDLYINGIKQAKQAKKVKLSDKGQKLNEVMKEFLAKKGK